MLIHYLEINVHFLNEITFCASIGHMELMK